MRRRTREWIGAGVIAAVVGGVMVLAPEPDPYVQVLAEARKTASDFQLEVLADGQITDAEIDRGFTQMEDCLRGLGFEPYGEGGTEIAGQDADRCFETTVGTIHELKWRMEMDPENKGIMVVIAECLDRHGVLPDGYEPADFRDKDVMEVMGDPALDFNFNDAVVGQCFTDPRN
ncbi:hypothetical protein [Georgenia thermotolerans]|uniref:Uncharacterized protein n=1 Tax=Georgenia thermotolerans TaxID=527326 RepID=A0A7J5UME4_9MICO|nr:hypothetical protein [Georgenia thermotolerans]KAE8763548.1 hypothetical protein GB883_13620 [Georgenia thermotolerans]